MALLPLREDEELTDGDRIALIIGLRSDGPPDLLCGTVYRNKTYGLFVLSDEPLQGTRLFRLNNRIGIHRLVEDENG